MDDSRPTPPRSRLPLIGLGVLLGAFALLVVAGPLLPWLPTEAWLLFAIPVGLLAAIVVIGERRRRR